MRRLHLFALVVSVLGACGGAPVTQPAPLPGPAPAPRPAVEAAAEPGKVVEMGAFSVELPRGAWRPTGDVSSMTMEIPRNAGVDESGGGFAFFDPETDVFVHGFDGQSKKGAKDPAKLAEGLQRAAEAAFTSDWNVTGGEVKEEGREKRRTISATDAQGLTMAALIVTIVDDGVVHGAGLQCVWKTAQPERAELCRRLLASLKRVEAGAAPAPRPTPASSAAPSGRSS